MLVAAIGADRQAASFGARQGDGTWGTPDLYRQVWTCGGFETRRPQHIGRAAHARQAGAKNRALTTALGEPAALVTWIVTWPLTCQTT